MIPEIKRSAEKKLVGFSRKMSMVNNRTYELWKKFMTRKKEITRTVSQDLYSVQVFPDHTDFSAFDANTEFLKFAGAEVDTFDVLPEGFESFVLGAGLYAVFEYKGLSKDPRIFQYIFSEWLPNSEFVTDNRPHFELLGSKYKNNDPDSEEEIWIPINPKP